VGEDITFVGLDVHKATIAVCLAEAGRDSEVRFVGAIPNEPAALDKLAARLSRGGRTLRFVYEAGPCGYGVYRHLRDRGVECVVVAPSLIPRRPGERIKTDRRDATALARLHRAGELTPVWVPDPEHEAIRDLVRARADMVEALRKARQRLQGFLLRHGRSYDAKRWTWRHREWLMDQTFPHPAQQVACQEYLDAVNELEARIERLTGRIRDLVPAWSMAPVVEALQAMRGVSLVVASALVAEVGDMRRFDSPRQLMAYLGLVPSEHSSGSKRRLGAITKAGSPLARRMLVEGAWTYRLPARVSAQMRPRLEGLPRDVREVAWKAQLRLCARYRRLQASGKRPQVVVTAIAREMVGFAWAIARMVAPPAAAA
jgi:transposase